MLLVSFLVIVPNSLGLGEICHFFRDGLDCFGAGSSCIYTCTVAMYTAHGRRPAARWAVELRSMRISVFMMAECELLGVEPNR